MGTRQMQSTQREGRRERALGQGLESLYTGRAAQQESEVALITERTRPTVTPYSTHQVPQLPGRREQKCVYCEAVSRQPTSIRIFVPGTSTGSRGTKTSSTAKWAHVKL